MQPKANIWGFIDGISYNPFFGSNLGTVCYSLMLKMVHLYRFIGSNVSWIISFLALGHRTHNGLMYDVQ